jgi:hypothetical protein
MSEPENILYNTDIIGNLNLMFDDDAPSTISTATIQGDIVLGKSSRTGNVTVYKDTNAITFSQEKLVYISTLTADIQVQFNSILQIHQ